MNEIPGNAATAPSPVEPAPLAENTPLTGRRILVALSHRPWPLRMHGISVRFLPILRYLAAENDVTLLLVNVSPAERPDDEALRRLRVRYIQPAAASRTLQKRLAATLRGIAPFGPPHAIVRWYDRELAAAIGTEMSNGDYDLFLWAARDNAGVLWQLLQRKRLPTVVDFIDSPTLNASRTPALGGALPRSWQLFNYRRWECRVRELADRTLYIAEADARAARCPGRHGPATVDVVPNGFTPETLDPASPTAGDRPCIGYLGHMAYGPNISAALRLYWHIFRPLRERLPRLELRIIGRDPAPAVKALSEDRDVHVTGTVERIHDHLSTVDVLVFPVNEGAGLQNKLLEGIWAERPCVVSPGVADGVGRPLPDFVRVADSDEAFQAATRDILDSREELTGTGSGRAWIERHFAWPPILRQYAEALTAVCGPDDHRSTPPPDRQPRRDSG